MNVPCWEHLTHTEGLKHIRKVYMSAEAMCLSHYFGKEWSSVRQLATIQQMICTYL